MDGSTGAVGEDRIGVHAAHAVVGVHHIQVVHAAVGGLKGNHVAVVVQVQNGVGVQSGVLQLGVGQVGGKGVAHIVVVGAVHGSIGAGLLAVVDSPHSSDLAGDGLSQLHGVDGEAAAVLVQVHQNLVARLQIGGLQLNGGLAVVGVGRLVAQIVQGNGGGVVVLADVDHLGQEGVDHSD